MNEQQSMADHRHGSRFVDDDGRCLACALAVVEDRIRELEAENKRLRKSNFIHSRMEITGKLPSAYTDDELAKMFAPWWEERSVDGLSPREVRLLETIVDRNMQIRRVLLRCRCAFCGHEFESQDHVAVIKAHMLVCDKHPMHAINHAAGDEDPLALIEAAKKVPMTADKVRVTPGDHIFVVHSERDISEVSVGDYEKRTATSRPDSCYQRTWHCYSTREAAEKARKA